MRRPTREQIDVGTVDAAAARFAEHGYQRTSLREVAEAVGYSKTGLLHRFAGKEALVDLAVQAPGPLRPALAPEGVRHGSRAGERLAAVPGLLAACSALDTRPGACDDDLERAVRVTAALAAVAAVAAVPEALRGRPAEVVAPLLVRIVLHVLAGQPHSPTHSPTSTSTSTS